MIHQISAVISQIGGSHFFGSLLETLGSRISFDMAEIYTLSPRSMHGVAYYQRNPAVNVIFPGYAEHYVEDPLYRGYLDKLPAGLYRPSQLLTRYPQSDKYASCCRSEEVAEELEYLVPVTIDTALVIWLSRSARSPAFEARSVAALLKYQAPLIASVQKHLAVVNLRVEGPFASQKMGFACGKRALTCRELQIVESMLMGKSAKATAQRLKITEGTVRIHRKNIYRKLDVHSQVELFAAANRRWLPSNNDPFAPRHRQGAAVTQL